MLKVRLVRHLLVVVVSALAATMVPAYAGAAGHPPSGTARKATALEGLERQIVAEINEARAAAGRKPIKVADPCLDRVASDWTRHLLVLGDLLHRNQTGVLLKCDLVWAGENILRTSSPLSAEQAVQAWLDSPAHRAVLLKRRSSRIGLSVRPYLLGGYLAVLNVGDAD